jgi:hypothetical protein
MCDPIDLRPIPDIVFVGCGDPGPWPPANPEPIPRDPGSIPDLVFVGYGDPGPIPDLVLMGYGDPGPIPDVAFGMWRPKRSQTDPGPGFCGVWRSRTMASGQSRANPERSRIDPGPGFCGVWRSRTDPGPGFHGVWRSWTNPGRSLCRVWDMWRSKRSQTDPGPGFCGVYGDPGPIPDLVFMGLQVLPVASRGSRGPRGSRGLPSLPGASRGEPPGTPGASWANPKRSQIDPRPGFYGVLRSLTNSLFFLLFFWPRQFFLSCLCSPSGLA